MSGLPQPSQAIDDRVLPVGGLLPLPTGISHLAARLCQHAPRCMSDLFHPPSPSMTATLARGFCRE